MVSIIVVGEGAAGGATLCILQGRILWVSSLEHRTKAQDPSLKAGRPALGGVGTSPLPGLQPLSAHRGPWMQSPHTPQRQGGPRSWRSVRSLPSTRPGPAKPRTSDIHEPAFLQRALHFQLQHLRPLNLHYLPLLFFICIKWRLKGTLSFLFHREK